MTTFTSGDVRFPTISGDGKTIVFEHDFGVWKLDVATKEVKPLKFDIAAETQETLVEWRDFNSQVDDFDAAPDGKRIAFSIHGEIFTAPVDDAGAQRLQDGPRGSTASRPVIWGTLLLDAAIARVGALGRKNWKKRRGCGC